MSVKATITVSISPLETECASCSFVNNLFLAPVARQSDESLEEFARPGKVRGELLRMALHRDDQPILRLDALDCAVLSTGGLMQTRRKPANRLMVKAVHANLVLARGAAQLGRGADLD